MLLGHSELRVTADSYTHLQEQTAAKATIAARMVSPRLMLASRVFV